MPETPVFQIMIWIAGELWISCYLGRWYTMNCFHQILMSCYPEILYLYENRYMVGDASSNMLDSYTDQLYSPFSVTFMHKAEWLEFQLAENFVSKNVIHIIDFLSPLFWLARKSMANVLHLSVHLGSKYTYIATQSRLWIEKLKLGDVVAICRPEVGSAHLFT